MGSLGNAVRSTGSKCTTQLLDGLFAEYGLKGIEVQLRQTKYNYEK